MLVHTNINLNIYDRFDCSLLHLCFYKYLNLLGNHDVEKADEILKIFRILLELGADIDITDKNNNTVTMLAARYNSVKFLSSVLEHSGFDIDYQNNFGETALFIAVKEKSYESVCMLLQHDANINHLNHEGKSVFDINDDQRIFDILNKYDPEKIIKRSYKVIEKQDVGVILPKLATVMSEHLSIVNRKMFKVNDLSSIKPLLKEISNMLIFMSNNFDDSCDEFKSIKENLTNSYIALVNLNAAIGDDFSRSVTSNFNLQNNIKKSNSSPFLTFFNLDGESFRRNYEEDECSESDIKEDIIKNVLNSP
jgi:hypothetical protein